MRHCCKIDFLVKHFVIRISCVTHSPLWCLDSEMWIVGMCGLNHHKVMKAVCGRLIPEGLNRQIWRF